MKKRFLTLFASVLILFVLITIASASDSKAPQPLLIVNGNTVITYEDFYDYLTRFESKFKFRPSVDRQKDILNLFTNEELIYLEAVKKGYTRDEELAKRFETLKEKGYGSNLTLPRQDEWLKKRFFAEHYLNEFRNNITKVTDDEILSFYETNKTKYLEPDRYTGFFYIIQSIKKSATEEAIVQITEKVKSMVIENDYSPIEPLTMHNFNTQNPDFNVVLYKTQNYETNNPKKRLSIPDEAVKEFMKLTPKSLTVTKVNNDYIISVLTDKSPSRILPFEEAKARAKAELINEKDRNEIKALFDFLRKANSIVINYELLK